MERKYNQGVADSNRRRVKHGGAVNARQGGHEPLYKLWSAMKDRCLNPDSKHYHRYGGRGITMCAEWVEDYAAFASAVSERPEGATLDRIDNNGNYEPNNVRWATKQEQANNRVTNVFITHEGLTMSLADWARHKGWKYGLLTSRWKKGLRGDELLAPPEYERGKLVEYKGELRTLPEWAKVLGVNYQTLRWRLNNGRDLL
jgi:hypothetical protein